VNLEFAFTLFGSLKPPVEIGAGPFGTRRYFEVLGGKVEVGRLNGRVLSGGGDWLLVGSDGFARLDVRAQMVTDDGASIYANYYGLLELNQKVAEAVANRNSTDFGDQYFRTTPRLETGDPRYAWLNQSLFVGEGRLRPGAVEYRVHRVT
jgi:Protein of unknown function (DUF3237)